MAIVIPRAFSSGALSIESNARYFTLGFAFDSTLVIAAVSVVFPWSMCPIVPTFRCGLFRSNFSLAMTLLGRFLLGARAGSAVQRVRLLAAHPLDDLFLDARRGLVVSGELHRVRRPPLRP